jgi:lipopolysaccharide export system protein LptA
MYFHRFTLLLLGVLLSGSALALSTDRSQPLQIVANKATIDNVKGIAIYEGNVVVTQGSIRIDANVITINYTQKQDIEKVVADGKPAHFKQRLDSGDDIKAKAMQMEYNAIKSMLYLRKDAELHKQRNDKDLSSSSAPHIKYDTKRGIIKAGKGNTKDGRTTVTIYPQPSVKKSSSKK